MKLSKDTLAILKNFSSINGGIQFIEGNEIRIAAHDKTVMGIAQIEETIPQDFAIYDLSMFLQVHSLFNEPELEFHDDYLIFKEGRRRVKYHYTDSRNVVGAPYDLELGGDEAALFVSAEQLDSLKKASNVMQLRDFTMEKTDDTIQLSVEDLSQDNNNNFRIDLDFDVDMEDFRLELKVQALNFLSLDYEIEIVNDNQFLVFSNDERKVKYYVAVMG